MRVKRKNIITEKNQAAFKDWLKGEEKAAATIEKYARDVRAFSVWLDGAMVTKELAVSYKQDLMDKQRRKATGINSVIAALNAFFEFMRWEIKLKSLKIQRKTFRAKEKELTKEDYEKLLQTAKFNDNERLYLVLQTICSTGIRVSELRFITVEAIHSGKVEVTNKGKARSVFLPKRLMPLLRYYAKGCNITCGCIFITRSGKPLNRSNIWAEMKKLCASAGVEPSKVFPHNLRALFARLFYGKDKDIAKVANMLGHSDINTTRIYIIENGEEYFRQINSLGLVMT